MLYFLIESLILDHNRDRDTCFGSCRLLYDKPETTKESTAQGSNYIDLNQPPILDVIQNGQTISDRSSSEDRQREVELESALLGEAIKKQESLTQIQTTDFYR